MSTTFYRVIYVYYAVSVLLLLLSLLFLLRGVGFIMIAIIAIRYLVSRSRFLCPGSRSWVRSLSQYGINIIYGRPYIICYMISIIIYRYIEYINVDIYILMLMYLPYYSVIPLTL